MIAFYKDSNDVWVVGREISNREGDWKLSYHSNNTYAKVTNFKITIIDNPITEIVKNDQGDKYTSFTEFNNAVAPFFVNAPLEWGNISGNIADQVDLNNRLLPEGGEAGQAPIKQEDGSVEWKSVVEVESLSLNKYAGSWIPSDLSPDSDAQYGDVKVADCWRPYLIDCTKIDNDVVYDEKELMRNNFLRFKDGSFAPTVGITEAMRAQCDIELYLDNAQVNKYCDAGEFNAADFYNEHGMSKLYNINGEEVRVLRPWETTSQNYTIVLAPEKDMWFIDNEQGVSGKKWKGVFTKPTLWDGIEAKKLRRTGIAPGPSTTVGNKFRNFFFLYNTGDSNTRSSKGVSNIVTMFERTDRQYPRTNDITQVTSVTRARENNADSTKPYPFSEGGHFALCAFISSMELKHKTKALHRDSLFGSGISSNDACSNEAQYRINGGVRHSVDGGETWVYTKWNGTPAGIAYTATGTTTYMSNLLNYENVRELCMESQMVASFAVEMGITENTIFEVYGDRYYYQNVAGVNGLLDGEMNVRIYKLMGEDVSLFTLSGDPIAVRIECCLRMSLVNGQNLTGDVFVYSGGGAEMVGLSSGVSSGTGLPIKCYLETDQRKFHTETDVSKNDQGVFDFESVYPFVGEFLNFTGYRKSLIPYSMMGGEAGGGILTGECAYFVTVGSWSSTENQRVRLGFRRGGTAHHANCSPRYVRSADAVSYSSRTAAGFAQVLMRS